MEYRLWSFSTFVKLCPAPARDSHSGFHPYYAAYVNPECETRDDFIDAYRDHYKVVKLTRVMKTRVFYFWAQYVGWRKDAVAEANGRTRRQLHRRKAKRGF